MTRALLPSARKPVRPRTLAVAAVIALGLGAGCRTQTSDEGAYQNKPRAPFSSDRYSSTRLILERKDSGFEVVSSTPSFGGVTQPNLEDTLPEVLERKQRLYEYTVRDSAGSSVAQGYFLMPLVARATLRDEDPGKKIHHVELDDPSKVVRVAIPLVADRATVEFRTLAPDPNRPYQEWAKEEAGSIQVEPSPAEPQRQEQAP